ncbi:uncharacterized protein (TIGR01319 family) [Serratia fonticola]|uniref:Uncharacterized protein (TIGR01319 family) n=1 Tax=Serratia fonticola TaxID=47917 RepID=A0A542BLA4_SERFO|nr:methylaspartate mutase accessory protein GlmL [Serratia fonticola]TQI79353.1 uncharacterized protein (TIGR01319 family) [Serratia fonticola]TQI98622.1 uncharacterized protein (TIGR01319 family) [Serratia fonticola]TVZ68150.1 uncharacterized protein (TIGR01319 family) [Serratia fonticola]
MRTLSIDIGSTWTKAALFVVEGHELTLINKGLVPTTTQNLAEGFFNCVDNIVQEDVRGLLSRGELSVNYSSSAKGGLAVAALGLVPCITLESAKVTAHSAGAKIVHYYSYKLTRHDIKELESSPPDILLFTGGTDGGEEKYGLVNARMLGESTLDCAIIFAGNRDIQDDVRQLLRDKDLTIVDNVLPDLDTPNPGPARKAICDVFLKRIVKGKGLDKIVDVIGKEPLPTPYTMYELVHHISQSSEAWREFMLFDMGGATTDVYSTCDNILTPDTFKHGLEEPFLKRTVEGDLGMRVSAVTAGDSARALVETVFANKSSEKAAFYDYLRRVNAQPEYTPANATEVHFDAVLAGLNVGYASERHAGTKRTVATVAGNRELQIGRDLTPVRKIIGTGGWLSRAQAFDIHRWIKYRDIDEQGKKILLPTEFEYYRDSQGLIPLLANVAREFPQHAAITSIKNLTDNRGRKYGNQ